MSDEGSPLVRIDRGNSDQWDALAAAAQAENEMGLSANIRLVTDEKLIGSTEQSLRDAFRDDWVIFGADTKALSTEGHPILCIDPKGNAPSFRAHAKDLWIVENNVSAGNLLFEELLEEVSDDGVLAGMEEG